MENATERRQKKIGKYFITGPSEPSYLSEIFLMSAGGFGILISIVIALVNLFKYVTNSNETPPVVVLLCAAPFFIGGLYVSGKGTIEFWKKKSVYDKAYAIAEPKPSDQQMDKWLEYDKKNIIKDAMKKLELMPEQILRPEDPLVIIGPQMPTYIAKGKDGILRFSKYEIVVIYLTNFHLGAYRCDLDFTTGLALNEETQEYHYTDIVSVSTTNENSPFNVTTADGKVHPIASHQQFSLSVANGDRIKVTVNFPQLEGILDKENFYPPAPKRQLVI